MQMTIMYIFIILKVWAMEFGACSEKLQISPVTFFREVCCSEDDVYMFMLHLQLSRSDKKVRIYMKNFLKCRVGWT